MSTQLIIGLLTNTAAFGVMGFRNQKLGIKTPKFLQNAIFSWPLIIIYDLSFIIILFSPESLWIKIAACLLMQFVINHLIWGVITGLIAGITAKKKDF